MSKAAILLVEDNEKILATNAKALRLRGYTVLEAETLCEARRTLETHTPHLMVLDIMLPDGNGLVFCRELRNTHNTPMLFLTALGEQADVLKGYEAGGVDYVAKPYSMDILLAKIEALLRFTKVTKPPQVLDVGPLRIDVAARRAFLSGEDMLLKPKEFAILELLAQNPARYLSAEEMYEKLWALPSADDVRTIHSHIYALRSKLEGKGMALENKRGAGYRLIALPQKA